MRANMKGVRPLFV